MPASPPSPSADTYHRERSKLMDAFADAEISVSRRLHRHGAAIACGPFAQILAQLRKIPAGPQYAKAEKSRVDELCAKLEGLLPVRADIVHAKLEVAQIGTSTRACFVNSRSSHDAAPAARLLTLDQIRELAKTVHQLADGLKPA